MFQEVKIEILLIISWVVGFLEFLIILYHLMNIIHKTFMKHLQDLFIVSNKICGKLVSLSRLPIMLV